MEEQIKAKPGQRIVLNITLAFLFLAPIVGWILPADFFDNRNIELCPSKFLFDFECLGCGITRAVMHFHNFDFGAAVYYNTLVLGIYPFLVYLWYRWIKRIFYLKRVLVD